MSSHIPNQPLSRSDSIYVFINCLFVGILVLTNLIGTKLFVFLGESLPQGAAGTAIVLTTGIISYPFTFLITDTVSELWGKKRADRMVLFGFSISLIIFLIVSAAKEVPPAAAWQIGEKYASFFHPDYYIHHPKTGTISVDSQAAQAAFSFVFDAPGLLLFASMLAYLAAQLLDNFLFHFWKRLTRGRYLWLRNNASTLVSQLADTIIVNGIFLHFYWALPWFQASPEKPVTILQIIITTYLCKLLIALLDTPLLYAAVYFIRSFLKKELPPKGHRFLRNNIKPKNHTEYE